MAIDATELEIESPEDDATDDGSVAEDKGTDYAAQVASYKRRQAGAEAARQKAEERANELAAKVAAYEAANQTAAQAELSELARAQARAEAAEARAAEAEANANAKILDKVYPNARKELPEITDEVRLARYEALLAEDSEEPPTPKRNNPPKSSGAPVLSEDQSFDDMIATLRTMPPPDFLA